MSHSHDGSMYMTPMSDVGMNSTSMDATMQMSFYWGKHAVILFSGWPGHNLGFYILALCFVFLLSFAVEVFPTSPQFRAASNPMTSLFLQATVYAVRMGFAYMVMLSVMSFNLGVFIVAVAGHTAGFVLVKARALAAANRAGAESLNGDNSKF